MKTNLLSQQELSFKLGVPENTLENKLIELNLKDPQTGLATSFAVSYKLALNSLSKDEANWYPLAIMHIIKKTQNDSAFYSDVLLNKFARVKKLEENFTHVKITSTAFDCAMDDFFEMFDGCKNNETKILFYHKLEQNQLLDYAKDQYIFDELHILAMHDALQNELPSKNSSNQRLKI